MTKHSIILDADTQSFQTNKNAPMSFSKLENRIGAITPSLGLLPPVVRYISPIVNGEAIVIIEDRPRLQQIVIDGLAYELTLPWHHWVFKLATVTSVSDPSACAILGAYLAFSTKQMNLSEHVFYAPYLPEVVQTTEYGWQIIENYLQFGFPRILDVRRGGLDEAYRWFIERYWHKAFSLKDLGYMQSYIRALDSSYGYPEKDKNIIKGFNVFNNMSIVESLNLLERHGSEYEGFGKTIKLSTMIEPFETATNHFSFDQFVNAVVEMNIKYEPPKVERSTVEDTSTMTNLEENIAPPVMVMNTTGHLPHMALRGWNPLLLEADGHTRGIPNQEGHVWSEDECDGDGRLCPITHYDIAGYHWLTSYEIDEHYSDQDIPESPLRVDYYVSSVLPPSVKRGAPRAVRSLSGKTLSVSDIATVLNDFTNEKNVVKQVSDNVSQKTDWSKTFDGSEKIDWSKTFIGNFKVDNVKNATNVFAKALEEIEEEEDDYDENEDDD